MLRSVGDDDLRRRVFQAMPPFVMSGDGTAQFGNAAGLRIVRMTGAHRLDRRLADMIGRGEVRLADAEVVDLVPLGLQLLGLGGHCQGGRGLQRLDDSRDGARHWIHTPPAKSAKTARAFPAPRAAWTGRTPSPW